MSWSVEIFVRGAESLEALAADIGKLLNMDLKRFADLMETKYEHFHADFKLLVYADHGVVNDRDMNFEDYPYEVIFWRLNTPDRERSQANTLKFATLAFDKLKETGKYSLMSVENAQKKLDSFTPPSH